MKAQDNSVHFRWIKRSQHHWTIPLIFLYAEWFLSNILKLLFFFFVYFFRDSEMTLVKQQLVTIKCLMNLHENVRYVSFFLFFNNNKTCCPVHHLFLSGRFFIWQKQDTQIIVIILANKSVSSIHFDRCYHKKKRSNSITQQQETWFAYLYKIKIKLL